MVSAEALGAAIGEIRTQIQTILGQAGRAATAHDGLRADSDGALRRLRDEFELYRDAPRGRKDEGIMTRSPYMTTSYLRAHTLLAS